MGAAGTTSATSATASLGGSLAASGTSGRGLEAEVRGSSGVRLRTTACRKEGGAALPPCSWYEVRGHVEVTYIYTHLHSHTPINVPVPQPHTYTHKST